MVPAAPPSPRCEVCHRILRSLTLPYSTAITDSLDSQAAPALLRIQFAGVTRVPLPPRKRGTTKLSYAAPPSPRCEACHRIFRSSALPYSTAVTGFSGRSRLHHLGTLSFLRLLNLFTEPAAKLSTFPWPCQSYAAGAGIPALPELPGPLLPPPCPA